MEAVPKTTLFYHFILFFNIQPICAENNDLILVLEDQFHSKLSECTNYIVKWLEDFNDRHLGNSELGRILGYEELKPKISDNGVRMGRMKKMGVALIPLIFHIGATSTWMLLTSVLAAKSVAIGLALLIFKIAVSSAKVASFFTLLKSKHLGHHHEYSWPPHIEHHGYARSLREKGSYFPTEWNSHIPESIGISGPSYKTIPKYKSNDDNEYFDDFKTYHS